jgi:hypothetical protein
MAMPPISAAQVIRLTTSEAIRVANPAPKPVRSRTRSKTGRSATAETRPHISE